jgi:hypothetical protein
MLFFGYRLLLAVVSFVNRSVAFSGPKPAAASYFSWREELPVAGADSFPVLRRPAAPRRRLWRTFSAAMSANQNDAPRCWFDDSRRRK